LQEQDRYYVGAYVKSGRRKWQWRIVCHGKTEAESRDAYAALTLGEACAGKGLIVMRPDGTIQLLERKANDAVIQTLVNSIRRTMKGG
jgi:hypothetical protein